MSSPLDQEPTPEDGLRSVLLESLDHIEHIKSEGGNVKGGIVIIVGEFGEDESIGVIVHVSDGLSDLEADGTLSRASYLLNSETDDED